MNKYDPLGILSILSTNTNVDEDDEYDTEVVEIINRCWHLDEVEMAYEALQSIFEYWFWKGCCKRSELMDMAVEIIEVLKEFKKDKKTIGKEIFLFIKLYTIYSV